MKAKNAEINNLKEVSFWGNVIKGSLMALSICLILILVFAFVLRFVAIEDGMIRPVNQIIKTLSILIGTFSSLKKSKEMGLVSGLLIGMLFTIISFVAFSVLDGNFEFGISLVNDCLFGSIIGAISGIIAVNIFKK